jgi:hypothetical protein
MGALKGMIRLSNEPGSLGLGCDERGLALGGVPLLLRTSAGFAPRPRAEIEHLLTRAYGVEDYVARVLSGIGVIARALNAGETARAMIAAVQLRLPPLDWNGAVRIAQAENELLKYSSNQPRDWHGRWTREGPARNSSLATRASFEPSDTSHSKQPDPSTSNRAETSTDEPSLPPGWSVEDFDEIRSDGEPPPQSFEPLQDWLRLPERQRNDELGDLLEWIANAKPEDELAISREITRLFYDKNAKFGGDEFNRALGESLRFGPNNRAGREQLLKDLDHLTWGDPAFAGQFETALGIVAGLISPRLLLRPPRLVIGAGAWNSGWAERGQALSKALGANLPSNFKAIDRYFGGVATSIKSIDLRGATYQDPSRLAASIDRYVDQLKKFKFDSKGWLSVSADQIKTRELKLAIPKSVATDSQRAAITYAAHRAKSAGVKVTVISIP